MIWQKVKKIYFYALVFLFPALILLFVYILRGVYPFGTNSVLVLDLNAQYIYYYEAFRDVFYNGKSLFYSFSRTLGGEMMGLFAYYLASPFSLVLLIFPKHLITEAVLCIILLKVGTASLAFSLYLKICRKADSFTVLIFSLMYSLMSYTIVQTMNPMWLDGLIFLPIIILSVERLVKKGSFGLLVLSLSGLFISHYYIGYMTGIFVFFYFLYFLFKDGHMTTPHEKFRRFSVFCGSSILAICCAMWLLLPVYHSLKLGKFRFTQPDFTPVQNLDIFDLFSKMLPFTYDSVNHHGLPFIYCGALTFFLVGVYFAGNHVKARDKIASACLFLLIFISFSVSTIDISLHGFQAPNWLNYRYSFLFSFFMLSLGYETYRNIRQYNRKYIAWICGSLLLLTAIIGKLNYSFIQPERTLWMSYACFILYTVLLYNLKGSPANVKNLIKHTAIKAILLILVATELFLNAYTIIDGAHKEVYYSDRPSYRDYFDRLSPATNFIQQADKNFYRSETVIRRTVNDPMALGIHGVSHSSSTLNSNVLTLLSDLGISAREHWSTYKGFTLLTDAVMGIRYIVSEKTMTHFYTPVFSENDLTVFHNSFALPIAFPVSEDYLSAALDSFDPFINQNTLLSTMLGEPYTEYFKLLPINEVIFENMAASEQDGYVSYQAIEPELNAHIEYLIGTACKNEMYLYLYSEYPRKVNLWKNREYLDTFFTSEATCIIPLGSNSEADIISLITTPIEDEYYLNNNMFYYLDTPLFEKAISDLMKSEVVVTKPKETKIRIYLPDNNKPVLFTSIPYEKGWKAKINGKSVPVLKTLDALLSIKLSEGEQWVELDFVPTGFIPGALISTAAILLFILIMRYRHKRFPFHSRKTAYNLSPENTNVT